MTHSLDDLLDLAVLEIMHPLNKIPPSHPAKSTGEEFEPHSLRISEQHHSENEEYDS